MPEIRKRHYVAYGSNMDRQEMKCRCPEAVLVCTARLSNHRFLINARGVATVVLQEGSQVHGLLWLLTEADEQELDRYEGVHQGLYEKTEATVQRDNGQALRALLYVAADSTRGEPRDGYMERIVAAAQRHALPRRYIDELRSWLKTEAGGS